MPNQFWRSYSPSLKRCSPVQGYILPLVMLLGGGLLVLGLTAALVVQTDRQVGTMRRQNTDVLATAEGGAERILLELSRANNNLLLGRNYDPINPVTNRNYLGADGVLNSGDEGAIATDEWTGYNPSAAPCFQQSSVAAPAMAITGTMNGGGTYTLRAYRYNPTKREGTVLIEGRLPNQAPTILAVTIAVNVQTASFPGILATGLNPITPTGVVALRGRVVLGDKVNIYYPSSTSGNITVTGSAAPGDPNRAAHLQAAWSSAADDVTGDAIQGTLNACRILVNLPFSPPMGTPNIGDVKNDKTLTGAPNQISYYYTNKVELNGNRTLTVDTTQGPVYLYVDTKIDLNEQSRILNIRTDGKPPRVGDLRIFLLNPDAGGKAENSVVLEHTTCIQDAFLYAPGDDLELLTTGPGCPSGRNTNFEGVAWAEMIVAARQSSSARAVSDPLGKIQKTTQKVLPGVTSGIYVPSDVSSLLDIFPYISWPVRYQFGGVRAWQQVRL
jgi:hypothetical protein